MTKKVKTTMVFPAEFHQRLREIKKEIGAASMTEVVVRAVRFYERFGTRGVIVKEV